MADSHADERRRRVAEDPREQGGENLLPQQEDENHGRGGYKPNRGASDVRLTARFHTYCTNKMVG